jgi:hypothetical protein
MTRKERVIKTASNAMDNIDPDANDEVPAGIRADYLMTGHYMTTRHLAIMHDVRPSAQRTIERIRKYRPDYEPAQDTGPCPLPYDWNRKNIVGISIRDRARARQWCINALLLGYSVHAYDNKNGAGFGGMTLAAIRKQRRDNLVSERIDHQRGLTHAIQEHNLLAIEFVSLGDALDGGRYCAAVLDTYINLTNLLRYALASIRDDYRVQRLSDWRGERTSRVRTVIAQLNEQIADPKMRTIRPIKIGPRQDFTFTPYDVLFGSNGTAT